jgi:translation initiation factor 2-alpha kinase 4
MGIIACSVVDACVPQIIAGVAYLHSMKLAHRDKPANMMLKLFENATLRVKIGDYGTMRRIERQGMTTGVGTLGYASPEDAAGMASSRLGDVWSVGVIQREMVLADQPGCADRQGFAVNGQV